MDKAWRRLKLNAIVVFETLLAQQVFKVHFNLLLVTFDISLMLDGRHSILFDTRLRYWHSQVIIQVPYSESACRVIGIINKNNELGS